VYPGFWTQSGYKIAEFSDRPFALPDSALHNLYEAKYITDYLEEYLDNHVYHGLTLRSRIRYGFKVTKAAKASDGTWSVSGTANSENNKLAKSDVEGHISFQASKLIVASGTTSIPNIPDFRNDGFNGEIVHIRNFAERSKTFLHGSAKHICVLGSGKSAADMTYEAAKAGHTVSWIIRTSGHGPGLFAAVKEIGPFKNQGEIAMMRATGTLSPSFMAKDTMWMHFLHRTRIGRWLINKVFSSVEADSFKVAGYDIKDGREKNGFSGLKPIGRLVVLSLVFEKPWFLNRLLIVIF
jgi:dimethylaniline monooxygenase (N-oxide forming)